MHTQKIGRTGLDSSVVRKAADLAPTPFYLYDEKAIRARCREMQDMPHANSLRVRYAMKANSSRALLQIIASEGLHIDASSLNEAKRAVMAGIEPARILLTTQEVPKAFEQADLEGLMARGLKYNACSLAQLAAIAPFASREKIAIGMRVHPGVGSGESVTRNTGDKYSCFGVHLSNLEEALSLAREKSITIERVHVHIGSGGEPEAWRENIERELDFVERYFPDATSVNFGGGFRVARMPDEIPADIMSLGQAAKSAIEDFQKRTGRSLDMEVEPGTFIMANAGYLVTSVMDIKRTGEDGFTFVLVDGGMETITRPLLSGSRHPFALVSKDGSVKSDEFSMDESKAERLIVVGRCCESGDSLTLDSSQHIVPRPMARPSIGDWLVVGGAGAYCASMSPFNYNSHNQAAEILLREDATLQCIRKRQSLEELTQNEFSLQ